jgi:hypothetical protein
MESNENHQDPPLTSTEIEKALKKETVQMLSSVLWMWVEQKNTRKHTKRRAIFFWSQRRADLDKLAALGPHIVSTGTLPKANRIDLALTLAPPDFLLKLLTLSIPAASPGSPCSVSFPV